MKNENNNGDCIVPDSKETRNFTEEAKEFTERVLKVSAGAGIAGVAGLAVLGAGPLVLAASSVAAAGGVWGLSKGMRKYLACYNAWLARHAADRSKTKEPEERKT